MAGELVIQAPRQGISASPHTGFGDVRNLDIESIPGIVRLNTILAKKTGTTVDAQVKWIVRDPDTSANIVALDANGVYYKSTDSGANWSEISDRDGAGQGIIIRWGYAFICETTTIDVIKLSDNSITNNWKTIDTDSDWHPMIFSKNDGKIYGGAGRYVFSIEQNSGQTFDPASAATYTFTQQALDLPAGYKIKCLEELGNNLMCGTWQGSTINAIRIADIFPWDRSAVSFGQPISLDEYGIHAMRNSGNQLVVLAGIDGAIYGSNGVSIVQIGKLPQDLAGGKYIEYYPGSIINYKQKIFFGIGTVTSAGLLSGMGVYSLKQTGRGSVLDLEHLISTLRDGTDDEVQCTALLPVTRDTLLVGWRDDDDATGFGIDLSSATSYAYGTDYSGYFDTPFYVVGTSDQPKKYTEIEFQFARPLRTGEGIRVLYRDDLTASFTTLGTWDFTTFGAKDFLDQVFYKGTTSLDIPASGHLQLRVSLLGSSTTTPELMTVILR